MYSTNYKRGKNAKIRRRRREGYNRESEKEIGR